MTEEEKASEIEKLKQRRIDLYKNVKTSHNFVSRVRLLLAQLENRRMRDEKAYEEVDRELAMLDGRYERCQAAMAAAEPVKGKKRPRPAVDLTREQATEIARQLGMILDGSDRIQ